MLLYDFCMLLANFAFHFYAPPSPLMPWLFPPFFVRIRVLCLFLLADAIFAWANLCILCLSFSHPATLSKKTLDFFPAESKIILRGFSLPHYHF